jgi:4-oxalocrotonate tautomerase
VAYSNRGITMPFVNIQILKGHSKQRKDEISRRVTDAISEVAQLPKEAIWVVFEDVEADDWYVGGASVTDIKAKRS